MRREGSTVRLRGDGADVTVTMVTPRIVRVRLETGGAAAVPSCVAPREPAVTAFEEVAGEPARLVTPHLQAEIASAPLRLAFLDARGEWLLREPPGGGMAGGGAGGGGRGRVRASLSFSGEQHFYGLGQGGGPLDRLGVPRQLWNSHLGH